MSLQGVGNYCNPSVENIAKELFLVMDILFSGRGDLKIHRIRLHETPTCYTDCYRELISLHEIANFNTARGNECAQYAIEKGIVEYDGRK